MSRPDSRDAGHIWMVRVMSAWLGETREWTDREEVALRTMWADGVPAQLIASHFRRSEHEVLEKAAGMRLPERVEP